MTLRMFFARPPDAQHFVIHYALYALCLDGEVEFLAITQNVNVIPIVVVYLNLIIVTAFYFYCVLNIFKLTLRVGVFFYKNTLQIIEFICCC